MNSTKEKQSHKLCSPEQKGVPEGKELFQSNIGRLILSLKVSTRNHCVNKNLIEHSVASYIRKEPGREDIHIYVQVNQVAVDPKGKKKIPQPCHSTTCANSN